VITRQTAATELIRRQRIKRSLTEFARLAGFEPAEHHQLLIDKLEAVNAGEITRLAVFMPPGSAKSTYCSILFEPWYLANNPTAQIIAASHTTELAEKWGRRVRNLIRQHATTLGLELSGDSTAAGRWALRSGGEYYAAGVGVGIAGFRADLAVIDDPVRSRQDANSKPVRERVWDWYKADLGPRLKPGARIVLIQTRWHEDDLAGRILEEMRHGGQQWVVLNLPAQAEYDDQLGRAPGEWLWDDEYGYADFLRQEKATQLPGNWASLFQQRPAPEEGTFFRSDWLRPYRLAEQPARKTLNVYGASDYAVTADGGDYTVHVVVGLDPDGKLWLLDLWRKQADPAEWVEAICDMVIEWRPHGWAEENIQITSGIGPYLDRRLRERKAWLGREQFPTRGDKAIRAASIRGRMALDGLYVPTDAPWYEALRSELLAFPSGKHDDQVDALGLAGQLLDWMAPGVVPKQDEDPDRRDGYRDAIEEAWPTDSIKML
jgi:predicted phage terminase large subunit-like protein